MPAIDIDRDTAHEAAQHELAKPIYPKGSLTERLMEWLDDLLYRIVQEGSSRARRLVHHHRAAGHSRRRDRGRRPNRAAHDAHQPRRRPALFDAQELSAAEHRATAEQYAAAGDWAAAIRHRLRAVARQLEEDGGAQPGARPHRHRARHAMPVPRSPIWQANCSRRAEAFNDVTYGERPGTEPAYRMIADLDDRLRSTQVARAPARPPCPPPPTTGRRCDDAPPIRPSRPTVVQRVAHHARWVLLALIVVVGVSTVGTYLTAPRPGGRMDPASTSPDGAHALVSLLRDHGVDVVVADDIADVERAARPEHIAGRRRRRTTSSTRICCDGWPPCPATAAGRTDIADPGDPCAGDPP